MLVTQPNTIEQVENSVHARIEQFTAHNGGVMYFNDREIFIASGLTRVLVNSIPEIANIIERFAFEWAKSQTQKSQETMGESLFNDDAVQESIEQDVMYLMQGKQREMYYQIRNRLSSRISEKKGPQLEELKHVSESLAHASAFYLSDCDTLITEMVSSGYYNAGMENTLCCVDVAICTAIGDFIFDHATACDFEMALDAIRMNLKL